MGNNFYLTSNSGGSGPELKSGGAAVVAGEYDQWTPIGVEATANGYEVAWRFGSTDRYTVWSTNSNGNQVSSATNGTVSGTSSTLESLETSFQQDLNGDGVIGLVTTVIESVGSTKLDLVGDNYYLDGISSGSGPELKYLGAPVVAANFAGATPIAVEKTSTGYEVAWKVAGADQYAVWFTDSNGNYLSNIGGLVSGSNATLRELEASFQQDLNGDGVIAIAAGKTMELTGASSATITFAGATGTLKIDNSSTFSGTIGGQLAIGDVIDLADITAGANATMSYSGNNSPGTLTVSDGAHTASIALLGNYSLANFTASGDGNGGTSVVDPPLPTARSANLVSENSGGDAANWLNAVDQRLALWSQQIASAFPSSFGNDATSTVGASELGAPAPLPQLATSFANLQHQLNSSMQG
jgi:20S proteasome alpha/beta subunit